MNPHKLGAGNTFPAIEIPVLDGNQRALNSPKPGYVWQLNIVYRGKHCPICTSYLRELKSLMPELTQLNIDVLALSADREDVARAHMAEVQPDFDVGYGLTVVQMQALGLYITGPRDGTSVNKPFAEPGLFVVGDTGELRIADISNVPFARPNLQSLLGGLRYIRGLTDDYPITGTHAKIEENHD